MPLKRPKQPMPAFVLDALNLHALKKAYDLRPPYQRNDYLLWINSAKRDQTKQKRLNQMLDELKKGDVYMKMAWRKWRRKGDSNPRGA